MSKIKRTNQYYPEIEDGRFYTHVLGVAMSVNTVYTHLHDLNNNFESLLLISQVLFGTSYDHLYFVFPNAGAKDGIYTINIPMAVTPTNPAVVGTKKEMFPLFLHAKTKGNKTLLQTVTDTDALIIRAADIGITLENFLAYYETVSNKYNGSLPTKQMKGYNCWGNYRPENIRLAITYIQEASGIKMLAYFTDISSHWEFQDTYKVMYGSPITFIDREQTTIVDIRDSMPYVIFDMHNNLIRERVIYRIDHEVDLWFKYPQRQDKYDYYKLGIHLIRWDKQPQNNPADYISFKEVSRDNDKVLLIPLNYFTYFSSNNNEIASMSAKHICTSLSQLASLGLYNIYQHVDYSKSLCD